MEFKSFYVYALVNPISGKPFYIGKGKDKRAWQHLKDNELCNESKLSVIAEIRDSGMEPSVVILAKNLLEKVALSIESYYINELPGLTNMVKPSYNAFTFPNGRTEEPSRLEGVKIILNE